MGGENWKATDVLGGHANSPRRGNKGLKHGNRGEGTGARDAWMILLGLLKIFTMLVFWGHNEDSTREKFILVTPGTVLSTQHSLYSPNYVLYNSLDHTHTHNCVRPYHPESFQPDLSLKAEHTLVWSVVEWRTPRHPSHPGLLQSSVTWPRVLETDHPKPWVPV